MKLTTLRTYGCADRQRLLKLIDSVAGEREYCPNASYSSTPQWEAALDGTHPEQYLLLIAQAGDELVGWCRLFHVSQDAAELGMGILTVYRHRKIGSEMLRRCMEWARVHGVQYIVLDTMTSNVAAQAFFRKHGFVETGRESRRIGDGKLYDAVLMQLEL